MTEVKDVFFLQEIFFNFKYCSTDFFKNPEKGGCGGRYRFIQ